MAAEEVHLVADRDGCHFQIQGVHGEGFYVCRFDRSSHSTHDYLQDTLPLAKQCALEEWGVPQDGWKPASTCTEQLHRA